MIPDEPDTDPCERASVRNSSVKTEEGQWLTTGQAAKYCSVKPDTVLKWIKRGRLTAERTPGGHYRIRPKDLEPLILTPRQVDAPPRTDRLPLCQMFPRPIQSLDGITQQLPGDRIITVAE